MWKSQRRTHEPSKPAKDLEQKVRSLFSFFLPKIRFLSTCFVRVIVCTNPTTQQQQQQQTTANTTVASNALCMATKNMKAIDRHDEGGAGCYTCSSMSPTEMLKDCKCFFVEFMDGESYASDDDAFFLQPQQRQNPKDPKPLHRDNGDFFDHANIKLMASYDSWASKSANSVLFENMDWKLKLGRNKKKNIRKDLRATSNNQAPGFGQKVTHLVLTKKKKKKEKTNSQEHSSTSPSPWSLFSSSAASPYSDKELQTKHNGGLSIVRSISIDSQSTTSTKELQASLAATIYAEIQASRDEEEENHAMIPPLLPESSGEEEDEKEEDKNMLSPIEMEEWCTSIGNVNEGQ